MDIKTFIEKSFEAFCRRGFAVSFKPFSEDLKWLIQCGKINAIYGYGQNELEKSNKTALDLIDYFGEPAVVVVRCCSSIGWALCSEDKDCISGKINEGIKAVGLL